MGTLVTVAPLAKHGLRARFYVAVTADQVYEGSHLDPRVFLVGGKGGIKQQG